MRPVVTSARVASALGPPCRALTALARRQSGADDAKLAVTIYASGWVADRIDFSRTWQQCIKPNSDAGGRWPLGVRACAGGALVAGLLLLR